MGNTFRALGEFFRRLADGDSVAVGILIGFLAVTALAFGVVYLVHRRLKADDEAWARRYGRK